MLKHTNIENIYVLSAYRYKKQAVGCAESIQELTNCMFHLLLGTKSKWKGVLKAYKNQ